jgi:subtilisin family serine protease
MLGIEYILRKARELQRPVVICIGLGSNLGSHDGYTLFEEYLSDISSLRGVCVCTAAGNESQERHHIHGKIKTKGETQNIDIKVGNNAGDIIISIWNNASDRFSVSVRSPSGELIGRVPAKTETNFTVKLVLEKTEVNVKYHFPNERSGSQLTRVKIRNSTAGIWTIIMHGDIVLDGNYDAWLPITGFVSPTVEFFSATPYSTITTPATMVGSVCCGAYNSLDNSLYIKSSWGPTRAPMMAPDLVAPGVNIGGFYPYGFGTMSGTSCACAILAGACALMLQWGIVEGNDVALSTYQIRAFLIRGCTRSEELTYPNTKWGYGSLNIMNTFNLMREL